MQRRAVLVVTAKLDKILAESFEASQGIDRRWLRAGTLHQGKIRLATTADRFLATPRNSPPGIDRRWLRAGTLHQGKILAGAPNIGDQVCVSSERNCRDDDPRYPQDGDGGEQYAASKVAACTLTAGSERSAILQ